MYSLVCIFFSIVILLYVIYSYNYTCPISNFKNKKCRDAYYSLTSKYGTPSVVFNEPGGFCVWFINKNVDGYQVYSVMLKDSEKSKTYITLLTVNGVDFSNLKNMYHDRINGELTVSSGDIDKCIDVLKKYNIDSDIFTSIVDDEKNINEKFTSKKIPIQP